MMTVAAAPSLIGELLPAVDRSFSVERRGLSFSEDIEIGVGTRKFFGGECGKSVLRALSSQL